MKAKKGDYKIIIRQEVIYNGGNPYIKTDYVVEQYHGWLWGWRSVGSLCLGGGIQPYVFNTVEQAEKFIELERSIE